MRTHAHSREPRAITNALDDTRDVRRAVELAHLARQADVRVDERFVVVEHVLGGVVLGALEGVGGAAEQVAPQRLGDELQEGQDARRAQRDGGAGRLPC